MDANKNLRIKNLFVKRDLIFGMVLFVMGSLVACEEKNTYVEPPPPKVTIAEPLQQEVIDYLQFTGNTRAFEEVEIRARVSGFLQSMHFTPGTRVDMGDPLFVIDPREYQAEVNASQAELNAAKAMQRRAKIEYDRAKRVFDKGAGRETDVVKWRGERDVAQAAIERAKASVERAILNLGYTQVTTPISGRVSRNFVDVGNLVGEGEPTLLTTITRYDPVYVYFNLNEYDLLRVQSMYRQRIKEKDIDPAEEPDSEAEMQLFLGLANEPGYPHEGVVDFAASGVDPATGTIQLRGVFPNPGPPNVLIPGLFTRLRMPIDKRENALLVTERAIGADQGGNFLLTVNSDNVVEKTPIRMGQLVDGLRVIEEGLEPGVLVIVKGLQRARPGGKVDPEKIDMKTLTVSAINSAAEAKLDQAKSKQDSSNTAPTVPAGDDATTAGKEEKPNE
ncbi:MAG: efflux RND transporter periplasmic adaptor subunit [bacterium]|nr:efflux RND transporter periplasmic adaptor subunit [bacterium]